MTALCGGGTSGPKPGADVVVTYTSGLLAAIFAAYDLAWLIPVIPLVGLAPLTLSAICATDPPAMPTFTTGELIDLLDFQIGTANYNSGISKLKDLATNLIWLNACQCTSGTLTPPSMPTPPSGTPKTQYQTPVTGGACLHNDWSSGTDVNGNVDCADTWTALCFDAHSNILSQTPLVTIHQGQTVTANLPIPAGTVTLDLELHSSAGCGNYSRGGPLLSGLVNPTLATFTFTESYNAGTNITHRGASVDVFCGAGTPISQVSQCCPTDPATQAQIASILNMVTLIQRQIAPFAYIPWTIHDALSGSGEISVQGLIGAKMTPSAIPNWAGIAQGDPDTLWLDSWINWGNADGWTAREFLRSSPYLSFPQLAGQFTKIGYSFAPGIFITIQELKRES